MGQEAFGVLILYLTCSSYSGAFAAGNMTMSTIIDEIFSTYDRKLSPKYDNPFEDRQVMVTVNLFINSMFSVNEIDMDYSMSLFLRQNWVDERLQFIDVINITRIELPSHMYDDIWMPDLYIRTEKSSDFHEVTVKNQMVHIYPNGTVQYSARITGTFMCNMDLRTYPFDRQHCKLEFESYAFSTDKLSFRWSEDPLVMADDIVFPQFTLLEADTERCDHNYFSIVYPCIAVNFILERNFSYHIIQIYLPSILIVILSWVNFWLDCTCVPGRVSLALLTVLTMTTQSSGAHADLPRVSYIKAIDIWMATCMTFVFLGLLEFAYVNVLSRVEVRRKSVYQSPIILSSLAITDDPDNQKDDVGLDCRCNLLKFACFKHIAGVERARAVDKISRVLFPAVFLLFNVFYWTYYFILEPDLNEHRKT